jgi:hypothetical protein
LGIKKTPHNIVLHEVVMKRGGYKMFPNNSITNHSFKTSFQFMLIFSLSIGCLAIKNKKNESGLA